MQDGGWLLYISFQNHNTLADTGKFVYKLDEKQLLLKQDPSQSHKMPSTLGLQ